MERLLLTHRESELSGCSQKSQRYLFINHHQDSFNAFSSSSSSPRRSSDIDFSDVFGGPPRRASIQETRRSFNAYRTADNEEEHEKDDGEEDGEGNNDEKPVFGDPEGGGSTRRRYPGEDFFDDIFKGKDLYSLSCSPRNKHESDSLFSAPGSRVLSPVRPLPPRAEQEQLGGSNFAAQFSLPSRLIKGTESPTFGSTTRNQNKNKDGGSNGFSNYSHSPLSRFSSQPNNRAQEVLESNVRLRSYLSKELSLSSEESLDLGKPDAKETANKLERQLSASDSDGPEALRKGGQFHFSIYKWASKGAPLDMPLRAGKIPAPKEKSKMLRASSFNTWLDGEEMAKRSPKVTPGDQGLDKQKDGLRFDAGIPSRVEKIQTVEEANLPLSKSESSRSHQVVAVKHTQEEVEAFRGAEQVHNVEEANLPVRTSESSRNNQLAAMTHTKEGREAVPNTAEMDLSKRKEQTSLAAKQEAPKTELKPARSLFSVNDHEAVNNTVAKNDGSKESKVKSSKKSAAVFDVGDDVKNELGRITSIDNGDIKKANVGGSPRNLRSSISKNKGGGKVKEFVKIFNQEAVSKPELNAESQRQNCWRKEIGKPRTPHVSTVKPTGIDKEPNSKSKNGARDTSILADQRPSMSEKQKPETKTNSTNSTSSPATTQAPDVLETSFLDLDDSLQGNFLIEELPQDDHKLPETSPKSEAEEVKVIDDKIRGWSRGKEGNIRSLLSTLQYILWPGSGWKTVPLVDIVEGSAVRRSYQKALLCLHPDKLQQKGATSHQKYIAEKVFDILQEAWTHFNSLGSV